MSFSGAVWQGAGLPPNTPDVLSTIDLGGGDQGQRLPAGRLPTGPYGQCLKLLHGELALLFSG